jgi:hypothetical protein
MRPSGDYSARKGGYPSWPARPAAASTTEAGAAVLLRGNAEVDPTSDVLLLGNELESVGGRRR